MWNAHYLVGKFRTPNLIKQNSDTNTTHALKAGRHEDWLAYNHMRSLQPASRSHVVRFDKAWFHYNPHPSVEDEKVSSGDEKKL